MAVLAAAFFAEGLWVYLYEPRYYDTAALGSESAPSSSSGWARLREWRWLVHTIPLGLVGESLRSQVYSQAF
jgi:hypothetical protein